MGEARISGPAESSGVSWRLEFYRRVGQPWLILDAVDAAFEAIGGFTRVPALGEERAVPGEGEAPPEVVFQYTGPDARGEFEFGYLVVPAEEDPGRADFPFEAMPFELRVPFFQAEAAARQAVEAAQRVAAALDLLVLDPQVEQETPASPDGEALIRSYTVYNRDVEETLEYVSRRGRVIAKGVLVILAAAIVWLALALISRG